MSNRSTYKTLRASVFGAIAAVALTVGCGNGGAPDNAQLEDEQFDESITEQKLDIDPDQARLQAKNSCADLTASTDDPANLDPIELARIVQKVAVKTNLGEDDAGVLIAMGIKVYCPEFKASFGK